MGDTIKMTIAENDASISRLWMYRVKAEALDKILKEIDSLGLSKAAKEIIAKAYAESEKYESEVTEYEESQWVE